MAKCDVIDGKTKYGIISPFLSLRFVMVGGNAFKLDTTDLEDSWKSLNEQIQELVKTNPEIQKIISELRKSKVRGTAAGMRGSLKDEKVINIEDFLDPK